MAIFENLAQARQRLLDSKPLTTEELRAFFPWLGQLAFNTGFPERVQIEMALLQIAAIDRFNEASGRLTRISIVASCLQVLVAAVALWIALKR